MCLISLYAIHSSRGTRLNVAKYFRASSGETGTGIILDFIFCRRFFLYFKSLFLIHFVLEYIQVVGGGHSDDVLLRVPGGVKDLLVEVQTVHADFVFLSFAAGAHLPRFEHGTGFTVFPRSLQRDVPARVPVKHSEEVVVGTRHDGTEGKSDRRLANERRGHTHILHICMQCWEDL